MPWPELRVQGHKRQTDFAIHRAFVRLASSPLVLETFFELLHCVRTRAPRWMEAPMIHRRHLGVEALVNLARFHSDCIRAIADWPGSTEAWQPAVASLAHHLFGLYPVPAFLAGAWTDTHASGDQCRRWYISHSRGAGFRSLDVPIPLTRTMERFFLASPAHMPIREALRRAELRAFGMPAEFTRQILATRLLWDLNHSEFWRSVWHFFLTNAEHLKPSSIAPIIDFLQAIRHESATVETPNGPAHLPPPQPGFSIKGRTAASVLRLMNLWHRGLSTTSAILPAQCSWKPSAIRPMTHEEPALNPAQPPFRWQMVELTDSDQLRREGARLHHCVASYALRCAQGATSIWSLRLSRGTSLRSTLTVEVHPHTRIILQARARDNRFPTGKPLCLLRQWASLERLHH